MAFRFSGLEPLHNDMNRIGETRAVFPFEYNRKPFSCIFLTDVTPMALYLTTLGAVPLSIQFELDDNYETSAFMKDQYSELVRYLELKFDPNHKFKPSDMFTVLNRNIPQGFPGSPGRGQVIGVVARHRQVEEADQIYFCGWYPNPVGRNVRERNYEKTRAAFGSEMADMARARRISSKWTDNPDKEDLARLSQMP